MCIKSSRLFKGDKADKIARQDMNSIEQMADHMATIKSTVELMVDARRKANRLTDERTKAIAYHDEVFPLMEDIRYHIDKLELMVDNEIWPLPKYRELLFIR